MNLKYKHNYYKWLAIVLVLGIGFGSLALTKSELFKQLEQSQKIFHWVNREIITKYVDDIDIDAFTKKSIQHTLSELDPYTVYMVDEERDGLDMLTYGKYGGVGIQISVREGRLTVVAPIDDTPAQRAGIISGDRILSIDGKPTDAMNLDEAAKMIRGDKGTSLVITIERFSSEEPIEFSLVREDIIVNDVAYSGMLDERTGYIRLTQFSKNSVTEMRDALKELKDQNAQSIILDLRDNPGGLLQSAIGVLDLLVPKGETLLTTKGKSKESNRTFKAVSNPVIGDDVKLAVLINGGSASASEIVAGALQDLDRAVVLGDRSFGKGLVQTVYNFDGNHSLKMTTAKYYIPSGRLIQKPNYNNAEVIAWTAVQDSNFTTLGGRTVKGGGGIFPDVEVSNERAETLVRECWRKGLFFSFAQENRDRFASQDAILIDAELLSDFKSFLDRHELDLPISGESALDEARDKLTVIDSTNAELNLAFQQINKFIDAQEAILFDREVDQIRLGLRMEFANLFSGTEGRVKVSLTDDRVVQKALGVLNNKDSYSAVFVVK
ncbi:MAG: S41 family peptidase [Candidatus Neomarinimicrobiota bacterium]